MSQNQINFYKNLLKSFYLIPLAYPLPGRHTQFSLSAMYFLFEYYSPLVFFRLRINLQGFPRSFDYILSLHRRLANLLQPIAVQSVNCTVHNQLFSSIFTLLFYETYLLYYFNRYESLGCRLSISKNKYILIIPYIITIPQFSLSQYNVTTIPWQQGLQEVPAI